MKVLLTGATGFIGSHVAEVLRGAGHEVFPATRANGVDFNQLQKPECWLPLLQGVEAVINCVGIIVENRTQDFITLHYRVPVALFHACVKAGVKRVIQVSALGADTHAVTSFLVSKGKADEVLRGLPLDWFIIRPSLVVGPGGQSAEFFQRLANLPIIPLIDGGRQWIQPVHIDDLVAAVNQCLVTGTAQRTIDAVGPQTMTVCDRLQSLRRECGKTPAPVLSIPYPLALLVSHLVQWFVPLCQPDNLRMLQAGNTADVEPFAHFIGRIPRELS